MTATGTLYAIVAAILTLALPRRWAPLPLVLGAAYLPETQVLTVGSANFTIPRLLVAAGLLRMLLRGERLAGGLRACDRLVLAWAALIVVDCTVHLPSVTMSRLGLVWTELGSYLLFRVSLRSLDDVGRLFEVLALLLLPLAALMLWEHTSGTNPFGAVGALNEKALMRNGRIRASGPFAHPILAGTAGAFACGYGLALWHRRRGRAWIGIAGGTAMVVASASSGPLLTLAILLLGVFAWPLRDRLGQVRAALATTLLALALAMQAPVYFLMQRIDLTGGSEGWFRAQLIHSAIEHLPEWWLAGTDHTRHWMVTGIYANARHTDIVNHYLAMGVLGGLPLLALMLLVIVTTFRSVDRSLRQLAASPVDHRFIVWALGALMFALVMAFFSATLFDQSVIFFWLTVAAVQAADASSAAEVPATPARTATARPSTADRIRPRPLHRS